MFARVGTLMSVFRRAATVTVAAVLALLCEDGTPLDCEDGTPLELED